MKEKTADEMMKELGYEKTEDIRTEFGSVYYKKEKHFICYADAKILFHYKTKKITIQKDFITMQELQAINKKVKELGWYE